MAAANVDSATSEPRSPWYGAPLLLALLAVLAGCRTTPIYSASGLPPGLVAPALRSLNQLDLGALARPSAPSNVLQAGDLVEVSIATGVEARGEPARYSLRVSERGMLTVPLVGPVPVRGLELTEAEQAIAAESVRRGVYRAPNVSVVLTNRRVNRVTVVGEVEEPGVKLVPVGSSDLLTALVLAGGLTDRADSVIEIRTGGSGARPGGAVLTSAHGGYPQAVPAAGPAARLIDLTQLQPDDQEQLSLDDGATVVVRRQPDRTVFVMGLVRKPDQFPMPRDTELRLLDAIAMAGGTTLSMADKVHVIRQLEGQADPVVIEASVKRAKRGDHNIRLAPGDVVSVEETPLTFTVDTIRNFIRFGFSSTIPGL